MIAAEVLEVKGVNLIAVAPEIVLSGGALALLILGSSLRRQRPALLAGGALAILAGAAGATIPAAGKSTLAFDSTVALDGFSVFFKLVLIGVAGLAVLASVNFLEAERPPAPEFYGLMILVTAGMMLMTGAADLILVFVALETFSLGLYVLAAFRRTRLDSQEGALKYFLTGSFSSAFLLYGIALIYGGTGTTRLSGISQVIAAGGPSPFVPAGLALLLVGIGFKVAAVPFHMWTPDAYQGSPAPVAGFIASGSKIAGFAVLLRVLMAAFPQMVEGWRPVVGGIAILTMVIGSVVAIAQTNVKRMLAYSSIAHSGFILTAVAAANDRGVSGSLFYLAAYTFVILGAFAVVYSVGGPGENRIHLEDYRGLWNKQPFATAILGLLLLSLAGIPPTAGFWAKVEVFSAAWEAGQYALVIVGVLCSAAAAFFYLRVIVLMVLEEPKEWGVRRESTSPATGAALLLASAVVIALGVVPTPLLDFARDSTLFLP